MKRLMILLLIVPFLISCTTVYKPVPLPMPERPEYQRIRNQDLICLDNSQYSIVAGHVVGLRMYVERLEAVIKSTWSQ